jgi:O-antigen/teichoic acid export membrane protein
MGLMSFNIAVGLISSVFYAVLMAYERFVFIKILGIISTVLNPLIMLPILLCGYKSLGMTVASTIINIVNLLIICYYSFKILKMRIHIKKFEKPFLKELFGFSFFVLLGMIVDKVYWGTDQFILGAVSGTVAVAVYNVGANFTTYFMSFSTAITGLFLPRLTQMDVAKSSPKEFTDLFIKVGRLQFFILAFILGGFIVLGRDFIILWAGANYSQAYLIALVILIPFIVPLIQNLGLQMMYARNLHKFRSLVLFGIAILNVVFSIPMAKYYGGFGCALMTGICFVIGQIIILNWFYYKRMEIDIPLFWKKMSRLLVLFMIILLLSYCFKYIINTSSWKTFGLGTIVYVVIYIFIMKMWGINSYEKQLILGLLPTRLRKL